MTRTLIIESGQKPTEEQLKEAQEAKKVLLILMKIVNNYHQLG